MTLNSASLGACNFTSSTNESQQEWAIFGDCTNFTQLEPFGTSIFYDVNDTVFVSTSISNFQGLWVTSRTASNALAVYQNPSLVASGTTASAALPNSNLCILGECGSLTSANRIGAVFWGKGLTSTQVTQIYNRLHTYFTAVGAPSGCSSQ
jgi:hypothetical protein